jgi:hypothetical protein
MDALVDGVEEDLVALGDLVGPEGAAMLQRLLGPFRPMVRARVLEALNDLVREHNDGDEPALVLSLLGDEVRLSPPPVELAGRDPLVTSDLTARIALRLPEQMKQEIESAARGAGVSANTWIVRSIDRGLRGGPGGPPSKPSRPGKTDRRPA